MLPIVRTFISLPAGVAQDAVLALHAPSPALGCLPWMLHARRSSASEAGDNWEDWKDTLHYVDYAVVALIVVGIAYLVVRRVRRGPRAASGARARCVELLRRAPAPPRGRARAASTGPAELLPVSSSAHWRSSRCLLGWPYPELDGELRKAFEVALHAGTAAALLVALRHEVAQALLGPAATARARRL